MFSVLILTKNEQKNLPECLRSVGEGADVVVLDSFSGDETMQLARAAGAHVSQRAFTDFADQRNYAHTAGLLRCEWTLHLDADERCTPELFVELEKIAAENPPELDGFFIAPKMFFQGRWIRRSTDFPAWQARFVRTKTFRFIEVGHGQREAAEMRMGKISASYTHILDACTDAEWEEKHRRYARAEAAELAANPPRWSELKNVFAAADPLARRRTLKRLWSLLPARPLLRFIAQFFLRGGFLDGPAGFHYCLRLARYERMIVGS